MKVNVNLEIVKNFLPILCAVGADTNHFLNIVFKILRLKEFRSKFKTKLEVYETSKLHFCKKKLKILVLTKKGINRVSSALYNTYIYFTYM